jgi:hypothetical protein
LATAFSPGATVSNVASTGQVTPTATGSDSYSWTSTFTFDGGAVPTSTGPEATGSTPTTTQVGSNASGAESWRTLSSVVVIIWGLLFSVSFLYVILL